MKRINTLFLFFVLPFLIDRITKLWALKQQFVNYKITDFLYMHLEFNRGVSWSLLNSQDSVTFAVLSAIIVSILIVLLWYSTNRFKLGFPIYGELLILSGGISNVIDRALYAGVVDFILIDFDCFSWPIFNFADLFIVLGVMVLIVMSYNE